MLFPTYPRKTRFACPPSPPWNLPFFTVKSTLFSLFSGSDPPLSYQDAALAHLDSLLPHDLVIWTDGFVPFSFVKSGFGVLATCHFVALRPPFLSWQAYCAQVFLLKPAPFCKPSAGVGSTNKSAISLFFSFSPTFGLSLPVCFLLRLSFYLNLSDRNSFLFAPLPLGYNESPEAHFFGGKTRLISWPDGDP